ncbi:MAG TPA: PAS domain S-box protein [Verrucomicrobiae bacterium]|nr:PAS domain S-box protein [Verrucomicrobiae bacterium]
MNSLRSRRVGEQSSSTKRDSGWIGYGMALFSVGAALLIRWLLDPLLKDNLQLLTFYGAVVIAVWFGGWRPGTLAAVLGYLAADYLFIPPRYEFVFDAAALAGLMGYTLCCIVIIYLGERMHQANESLIKESRERREIENSLAEEKELLSTTLASIGDGVIVTDIRARVISLNSEAEQLTGWSAVDAIGQPFKNVFQILNERTGKPAVDPVEKVLRLGMATALANHTVLVAKDGRHIPIEDSASPIREAGGALLGVVLVFRDVTQQRLAERERGHLAAIVEYSGDAVVSKDLNGVIQSWNASAQRLFGYRPDEIIGKSVTLLIPRDRLEEEEQILARLRRGLPAERIETLRVAKDGRQIPVSVSVSPIKDKEGRVIGASTLVHDISERKRIEKQLLQHREELEHCVAERTAQLNQSLLSLEELLYTIAHDLRAPNRAMQGYSHLLDAEYGTQLDQTARGYLQRISAAALRNDALICDLLEFGRLAHTDVPVTAVDARRVAEAAVEDVQAEARKRHATIEVAGEKWPLVAANATLLEQVFCNLVGNALKYVPPERKPHIELSAKVDHGLATLRVKDNGLGIPAENQANIFEPFTRLSNAADSDGTGMGLAIVRKAAERMRGKAGVESQAGEGSSFWIQLPLAPRESKRQLTT